MESEKKRKETKRKAEKKYTGAGNKQKGLGINYYSRRDNNAEVCLRGETQILSLNVLILSGL